MTVDTALIPENEAERLAAVRRYDILDTPPDGAFDRITALGARLFGVPICIVSIVDEDRIWFKSHHGLDVEEIPRDPGLCASAILQETAWVINDAVTDPRALANPLVAGDFGLRFYAAAPLTTSDGFRLGTINVIDLAPREVTEEELATLADLAAIVVDELELRLAARREEHRLEREHAELATTLSHELRTPVSTIYGATQSLLSDRLDEARRDELLGVAAAEAVRLKGVVDNLLAASELEGTAVRIVTERLDPVAVVRSTVEAARAGLPDGLTIEVESDGAAPPVLADAARLRKVLGNLLENAIRVSPAGGRILVRVGGTVTHARITVRDESSRSSRESDGLGLYVARELAWRMNGRLWQEPGEETASAFVLELPAS